MISGTLPGGEIVLQPEPQLPADLITATPAAFRF